MKFINDKCDVLYCVSTPSLVITSYFSNLNSHLDVFLLDGSKMIIMIDPMQKLLMRDYLFDQDNSSIFF